MLDSVVESEVQHHKHLHVPWQSACVRDSMLGVLSIKNAGPASWAGVSKLNVHTAS